MVNFDFESLSDDQKTMLLLSLEAEANRLESLLREYGTTHNRKPTNPVVRQLADEGVVCRREKANALRAILSKIKGKDVAQDRPKPMASHATPQ